MPRSFRRHTSTEGKRKLVKFDGHRRAVRMLDSLYDKSQGFVSEGGKEGGGGVPVATAYSQG